MEQLVVASAGLCTIAAIALSRATGSRVSGGAFNYGTRHSTQVPSWRDFRYSWREEIQTDDGPRLIFEIIVHPEECNQCGQNLPDGGCTLSVGVKNGHSDTAAVESAVEWWVVRMLGVSRHLVYHSDVVLPAQTYMPLGTPGHYHNIEVTLGYVEVSDRIRWYMAEKNIVGALGRIGRDEINRRVDLQKKKRLMKSAIDSLGGQEHLDKILRVPGGLNNKRTLREMLEDTDRVEPVIMSHDRDPNGNVKFNVYYPETKKYKRNVTPAQMDEPTLEKVQQYALANPDAEIPQL